LYYMSGMVAHKIVNGKWVVMGNNSELELKMGIVTLNIHTKIGMGIMLCAWDGNGKSA